MKKNHNLLRTTKNWRHSSVSGTGVSPSKSAHALKHGTHSRPRGIGNFGTHSAIKLHNCLLIIEVCNRNIAITTGLRTCATRITCATRATCITCATRATCITCATRATRSPQTAHAKNFAQARAANLRWSRKSHWFVQGAQYACAQAKLRLHNATPRQFAILH
jgi:hypothetical protein